MKSSLKAIAAAMACMLLASTPVYANPDIKDLLKGAASQMGGTGNDGGSSNLASGLKGLVEGLITKSNLTEDDLVGSYRYSAPAVAFQSDNFLQKAGGAAAAGVIEGKLAPIYAKTGIDQLTATFTSEHTFEFRIKSIKLSGTFSRDSLSDKGDFLFQFKVAGKIPMGQFKTHVEKVGSKLSITFDVSKLIMLVNQIATITGQGSIQSIASMLNSYEGLNCGFELSPDESAKEATDNTDPDASQAPAQGSSQIGSMLKGLLPGVQRQ